MRTGGNGLEAGVMEMLDRMQTGRWKVVRNLRKPLRHDDETLCRDHTRPKDEAATRCMFLGCCIATGRNHHALAGNVLPSVRFVPEICSPARSECVPVSDLADQKQPLGVIQNGVGRVRGENVHYRSDIESIGRIENDAATKRFVHFQLSSAYVLYNYIGPISQPVSGREPKILEAHQNDRILVGLDCLNRGGCDSDIGAQLPFGGVFDPPNQITGGEPKENSGDRQDYREDSQYFV